MVTIQQHRICFVIDLLMCGSSEAALLDSYIPWFSFYSGIKLDSYK